jgi:hypothetical protein
VLAGIAFLPAVSAAGAAARSISELGPLLAARPTIYAAETAGRDGAVEGAEALRLSEESIKRKVEGYLLNPEHAKGGPKADWFNHALGFTRENATELERQIIFDPSRAVQTGVTQFGSTYNQVISISGPTARLSMCCSAGYEMMTESCAW